MLTQMDDYPRHQIVDTMAHVGSSDLTWSDGYYFCIWDPDGEVSLATGMRVYPNLDVMEGYAAIMHNGELRNVRMSRRWSARHDDLEVVPLRMEILEGLRRRRLVFAAPSLSDGMEFDLVWEARHAPYEEERRAERLHGRVIRDLIRYWQAGRPSGRVKFGGRALQVDANRWYCIMDHSWGTRSSVGPRINPADLPPIPTLPAGRDGLLRLVGLVQMPSYIAYFQTHEDASGRPHMEEGRIDYKDGRSTRIVKVSHELEYRPGTRRLERAKCVITDEEGRKLELRLQPSHTPTITSALGYSLERRGFSDDRGMGVYRGEEWVESDMWRHDGHETVDPEGGRHEYNGYIGPAAADDGQQKGMAYFETVIIGSYPRYGFVAGGPMPVTLLPIA